MNFFRRQGDEYSFSCAYINSGDRMRRYLALFGILVLAACAIGTPKAPAVTSQSLLERAPGMTEDEAVDYVADLAESKLNEICRTRQTLRGQFDCVREAVLRGFDATGEGERNCDFDESFEDALKCVIVGSLGYELARREDLDIAKAYDWQAGEESLKTSVDQLGEKLVKECLASGLAGIDSCLLARVGQAFSLPESQVSVCTDPADTEESINCLARSFMLQHFGTSIEKMGAGEAQA